MMLGMSQEKLGEHLGITFQQIQKYEKGTNRIGASRLQHIARVLSVPVSFFFEDAPGTPAYNRAKKIWGARVHSTSEGDSLSAELTGTIDSAVADWMKDKDFAFAALEVGTRPVREVFEALRKDNWLHLYAGLDHPDAATIKRQIRAAFYTDTPEWKRAVWAHGVAVVDQALAALAG